MDARDTFGFEVEYHTAEYDGATSGWQVNLPHQCDSWCISTPTCYDPPVDQAEAVRRMEAFIAEASEALAALREGRQYPAPATEDGA